MVSCRIAATLRDTYPAPSSVYIERDTDELVIEFIYPVTHPFAKINNLIAALSLQSPSH
ncbi:hypothetical protein CBM2637_B110098 [Cupriavidus taiwanensis]|nr:hypothetical protein CBM2637_B110098 [Cupriavidus taiwanensis]